MPDTIDLDDDGATEHWVLDTLAAGVTVTITCSMNHNHRTQFTLRADGTTEILDPECAGLDYATTAVMTALGDHVSACHVLQHHLDHRLRPRTAIGTMVWGITNERLRVLHTAVAWAQLGDHRWGHHMEPLLAAGVTPRVHEEWRAAGWDGTSALRFQREFATLDLANQWREAGQVTTGAAKAAGLGIPPGGDPTGRPGDRLIAAGLPAAAATTWVRTDAPPEVARAYHRAGFTPTAYRTNQRLTEHRRRWPEVGPVPGTGPDAPPVFDPAQWKQHGLPAGPEAPRLHMAVNGDLVLAARWLATGASMKTAAHLAGIVTLETFVELVDYHGMETVDRTAAFSGQTDRLLNDLARDKGLRRGWTP